MWSLYERKEEDSGEGAGLFNYSGEKLEPLEFSNGKTQADVVKEILDSINAGNKIIFVRGVCGTGKSAIALNLARHFNKTSIVVPIKSLQSQYEKDYSKKKFIMKEDGKQLKISVVKGRNNFRCPFSGERADDPELPCTIEIREKNTEQLLKFVDMNENVDRGDFSTASDVRRMNIAPACPYWAPLMPAGIKPKGMTEFKEKKYAAICGKDFSLYQRKKGCEYCDQYTAYCDSDVMIFNSMKYLLESSIGRKPKTDLDIIDECDEFLDSFANERKINLNRLQTAMSNLLPQDQEKRNALKALIHAVDNLIVNPPVDEDVMKVDLTELSGVIDLVLENPNLAEDEETNYYNNVVEIARSFEKLMKETYVSFEKIGKDNNQSGLFGKNYSKDDTVLVSLVSINLAEKFREIVDQNNVLVLMSVTLHSEQVLKDIFGMDEYKIIEAETKMPGVVTKYRTGLEKNCKFANFQNGTLTRRMYLKVLDVCMANATPPTLIHVSAFKDLPTEEENAEFKFDNLITQERLRELQSRGNHAVDDFASGGEEVLFTTKCSRGVDFAGDKCNSIILTRFPYPNIRGLFWRILKKEQPEKFMEFYMDKARRELIQKVARGVRFKGDKVTLLSPDIRVLTANLD